MGNVTDIILQREIEQSSWFGFSMILTGVHTGKRDRIVKVLKNNNIEVRPIVAGNFTRNPAIKYFDYNIHKQLTNADYIHDHGFFIGNHSKSNKEEIDYFIEIFTNELS